jgi:putative sterol carrier protein
MSQQLSVNTPEELAALIDGRSDSEIVGTVSAIGVDEALDRVFDKFSEAFLPHKAAGESAEVQWDIATPDGVRKYVVKIVEGKCEASRGTASSPRVTMSLNVPDFLRLVTGKLSGMQAFFAGKLKVSGDVMFAQTQQNWFKIVGQA